jgi:signal transduction histidine kinase
MPGGEGGANRAEGGAARRGSWRIPSATLPASTVAFSIGVVALLVLLLVSFHTYELADQEQSWVMHTYQVIDEAKELESLIMDAETGERGYLLTAQRQFLEPYLIARRELPHQIDRLRTLTSGDSGQFQAVEEIDTAMKALVFSLQHEIDQVAERAGGVPGIQSYSPMLDIEKRLEAGRRIMDGLRARISSFLRDENLRLERRLAMAEERRRIARVLIACAAITALVGKIAASISHHHQLRRRQHAEEEQRRLNQGLEQEVASRTHDLRTMNEALVQHAQELARLNHDLEAFSYTVSHDLRSPLRSIEGFTTILARKLEGHVEASVMRQLEIVRGSAQHMSRLLTDVLEFSRLGRQALKPTRVSLAHLAERVVAERRLELAERRIEIAIDPAMPPCQGDESLLYLVVANLLGNAIKYTRGRDPARITVGWKRGPVPPSATHPPGTDAPPAVDATIYFVSDNGCGFDMQYYDKIFGVFQRLHSDEDYEGVGIGLATVKRIIDRHGGRVWAEAVLDQGASFFFTIGESA